MPIRGSLPKHEIIEKTLFFVVFSALGRFGHYSGNTSGAWMGLRGSRGSLEKLWEPLERPRRALVAAQGALGGVPAPPGEARGGLRDVLGVSRELLEGP